MRDNFTEEAKRTLASRVGNLCSNPGCRALTSGPQDDPAKALNVGVAAHITAAALSGPRYDSAISSEQRCHPDNGVWLCQNCAKLVDNDTSQFPAYLLRAWKTIAEHSARSRIGKTTWLDALQDESHTSRSAPPPESAKLRHNIKFVETGTASVHSGTNGDNTIYRSPQNLGDFLVSVACFRNEAVVGLNVHQPRLKAHIIYRDKEGNEVADVPRAVWLDHYGESVLFETGNKKCLVVFLLSNQDTLVKLWNETYTTAQSWMAGGPQFRIRKDSIIAEVASVEISLLSDEACALRAVFSAEKREIEHLPRLGLTSFSA